MVILELSLTGIITIRASHRHVARNYKYLVALWTGFQFDVTRKPPFLPSASGDRWPATPINNGVSDANANANANTFSWGPTLEPTVSSSLPSELNVGIFIVLPNPNCCARAVLWKFLSRAMHSWLQEKQEYSSIYEDLLEESQELTTTSCLHWQ